MKNKINNKKLFLRQKRNYLKSSFNEEGKGEKRWKKRPATRDAWEDYSTKQRELARDVRSVFKVLKMLNKRFQVEG